MKLLKRFKIENVLISSVLSGLFFLTASASLSAQDKSCQSACDLYFDCFSIAYQQTDEGKTQQGKTKLKQEKSNVINKCIKECNAKSKKNILQCYKERTPTIEVCKAFYNCSVKYYKTDDMKKSK